MSGLWEEVKTRKIFKAATIYAAITWGVIQIADILIPVLGISEWVMSSMVLIGFSGFPLALIFGWTLDLKIERQNRQKLIELESELPKTNLTSRLVELSIIGLFSIGATYLYYNSVSEPVKANIKPASTVTNLLAPANQQKTIAVLPFVNFSDSSNDEFFADGLSEELLNVLARNKKLRVAARTSSFHYKNANVNIKNIAEELGVQYILEGSVRRSGDLIRVTAQLIKADEDVHVFSKSWDRNINNVFEVQDEIAQSVLEELRVSLLGELDKNASEIGTKNIAAFEQYSRGLAFLRNRSKSDFENAIIHFNDAIKIEPHYAEAIAMLAETYFLKVSYGYMEFKDALEIAQPLVTQALELNPELGSAHAVKGLMHWQMANQEMGDSGKVEDKNNQLDIAVEHLIKAIDINPSLAEAFMWYGSILQEQGNFAEGLKLHKKAYDIDPRAAIVGFNWAQDLIRIGDYKQAMDVFNSVVRYNPNYANAYSIAGDVSYAVGQLDQAYGMYNRLAELNEDPIQRRINANRIYLPMGMFQLAQNNVDELKAEQKSERTEKFDWLQVSIWLASKQLTSFYQWTETFKENTSNKQQRLWRGLASLKQEKWQFAIDDMETALSLSRDKNKERVDESTVRIELFLVKAYQGLGDQFKANNYLNMAQEEIVQLKNQGFDSQTIRYHQAALAALSGEQQQAIALLRQAIQEGFVDLWLVDIDPVFTQVKTDPAFQSIRDEFNIRIKLMQNNIESQYGKLAMVD